MYSYVPTSLGGLVTVECACGAKWQCSDFGVSEVPARSVKDIDCGETDVLATESLLSVAKYPGIYFHRVDGNVLRCVEAYLIGMGTVMREVCPEGARHEVMSRLDIRLMEHHNLEASAACSVYENLARSVGDGEAAFEMWRDELHSCLLEEFPSLADRCGLSRQAAGYGAECHPSGR